MSKKSKSIDYLFEDPPVSGQRFALVTIVGPHMPQKCDTWGLKIRGVTDNLESAKSMTKRLMNIDNNYDIYTVEVGKFFPLAVEPYQVGNVEYHNSQLNDLIKTYLENKEQAKDHFNKRKNEMIEQAIKEGQNQEELSNRPEHPVAVLQRIQQFEESIEKARENLLDLEKDLQLSKTKFQNYTDEERELANKELESALRNVENEGGIKIEEMSTSESNESIVQATLQELDAKQQIEPSKKDGNSMTVIEKTIAELKIKETELEEANELLNSMEESKSPNVYKRMRDTVSKLNSEIMELKETLNNNEKINDFINANYVSDLNFDNEPQRYRQANP